MSSITKNNTILISVVILFVASSYLIKLSELIFDNHKNETGQPVNYNIIESKEDFDLDRFDSNFISLSNEMIEIYEEHKFSINNFINGNTKKIIIFSSLPDDFMDLSPLHLRKDLFIKTILPIVFVENKKILNERKQILNWWTETDGEEISRNFWPEWLNKICKKYMYNKDNLGELLAKVDIIPISLAITQAVKESNWGSTNYARQGNAVFGEYTFNIQETIASQKNLNKEDFVKRKYKNLSESVASYLRNLNTNKDFKDFRERRKKLRMEGKNIVGLEMIDYLENQNKISSYRDELKKLMEENNFKKFDELFSIVRN